MRKFYLAIILSVFASYYAFSQCTPIQFPGPPLTKPDTSQGLPPAVANLLYQEVIHVRIPHDTIIPPFTVPIPIDTAKLSNILGLPTGFTYVTNSPSDYWLGGTYGCIVIQGTAAESDTGNYQVSVDVLVVMGGTPFALSYTFKMVVLDSTNAGFSPNEQSKFLVHQNAPNPFTDNTIIKFNSLKKSDFNFEVYDLVGNIVEKNVIHAQKGINKIFFNKDNLLAGIYFYKLSDNTNTIVKRMVIK
ncbi:MAG: hypothetical protein AUJ98_08270 [Bacteroidetes bacterium CG2_30_33_31]|nr:MAG: hypothetical protein AUJ98_08270 [Bacteroidetes bacterium CG2_30_33_31]